MTMEAVAIKPFLIGQYDGVFALWEDSEGVGLSGADRRDQISAYLERNPGMSFVALEGNKIVGAILGGHDGRRGYIHHLAVAERYRRRGIGRKLVDHCLSALAQVGIQKCHLFIFHQNEAGITFWEGNGWEMRQDIKVMSRHLTSGEGD